jgi:hypothetical protein
MHRVILVVLCMAIPRAAEAQAPVAVPNPMASHTVFLIIIVAAFLAWAASFSLNSRRDSTGKSSSKSLRAHREAILDEIAQAESDRKAGRLDEADFEKRSRQLRGRLAAVLAKLESTTPARQTKR